MDDTQLTNENTPQKAVLLPSGCKALALLEYVNIVILVILFSVFTTATIGEAPHMLFSLLMQYARVHHHNLIINLGLLPHY